MLVWYVMSHCFHSFPVFMLSLAAGCSFINRPTAHMRMVSILSSNSIRGIRVFLTNIPKCTIRDCSSKSTIVCIFDYISQASLKFLHIDELNTCCSQSRKSILPCSDRPRVCSEILPGRICFNVSKRLCWAIWIYFINVQRREWKVTICFAFCLKTLQDLCLGEWSQCKYRVLLMG